MKNKLTTQDFDYPLDESKIAQHPPEKRDAAKMLVLDRNSGQIQHTVFTSFPSFLTEKDVVVINDTRVMPARLYGHRQGKEEKIELLLLRRLSDDTWECIGRPGKKIRVGSYLFFGDRLQAEIIAVTHDGNRIVRFFYEGIWEEVLDALGEMPLPPYIHEKLRDRNRYQTVYAKHDGSAAAPTAGLHFTEETFLHLKEKGIPVAPLTLHVGLGTFRPVQTEEIESHHMHAEWYTLPEQTVQAIQAAKKRGGRVVAIGTTSLRVLETVGARLLTNTPQTYSGWSELFVRPGFRFGVTDALLTNFHLPKSTLLMLVSAFSSREAILQAYAEADQNGYRFFSFGDCMLLI